MTLHRFADAAALVDAVARHFVAVGGAAIAATGAFRAALAGGSTPRALHGVLASRHRDALDWRRVVFYLGDERCVAASHPDSNGRMVRETLLVPLGLPDDRLRRPDGDAADPDAAARDYQQRIAADFGVAPDGPPPRFDWIGLGLGADAHTASLFPGTRALEEERAWVVANDVPSLDARRITFTFPLLEAAERRVFVVSGGSKAAALRRVLEPAAAERDWHAAPAARLSGDGSEWWIDESAGALLAGG